MALKSKARTKYTAWHTNPKAAANHMRKIRARGGRVVKKIRPGFRDDHPETIVQLDYHYPKK